MLVHMLIKSAAASSRAHKTHLHAWFTVAWIGISVRHGWVHADELMSRCSRVMSVVDGSSRDREPFLVSLLLLGCIATHAECK